MKDIKFCCKFKKIFPHEIGDVKAVQKIYKELYETDFKLKETVRVKFNQ